MVSRLKISNLAAQVNESATLAAGAKAAKLKKEGNDVISLTLGEPHFETLKEISDEYLKWSTKATSYTPAGGLVDLRERVANDLSTRLKLDKSNYSTIITAGTKPALFLSLVATLDPGDEVIVPAPYWVSYREMVLIAGGIFKEIPTTAEQDFKLSAEQLECAITPKTKAIIINSPSNPTGVVYTKEELEDLAAVIRKLCPKILIISDEIYSDLTFKGADHHSIATLAPDLITLIAGGWAKNYAVPGWRVGYGYGPTELVGKMIALQSHVAGNPPHPLQRAVMKSFEDGYKFPKMVADYYAKGVDRVLSWSQKYDHKIVRPGGAFYVMLPTRPFGFENSVDFANKLLNEKFVGVVAGKYFGAEGYVRLSVALDHEKLSEGLERIESFLK